MAKKDFASYTLITEFLTRAKSLLDRLPTNFDRDISVNVRQLEFRIILQILRSIGISTKVIGEHGIRLRITSFIGISQSIYAQNESLQQAVNELDYLIGRTIVALSSSETASSVVSSILIDDIM